MPIQLIKDFKYLPTVQYTQCSCMALCCVHINRMIESDVVSGVNMEYAYDKPQDGNH